MSRRLAFLALAALASTTLVTAGCMAPVDGDEANETETDDSDLTAAGKKLIGGWEGEGGAVYRLVLTSERVGQQNRFYADVDTGIRCVRAPCPSQERIEGTFSAGTKTITLRSTTASSRVASVLGKYRYTRSGDAITLTKSGKTLSFMKEAAYCAAASECAGLGLIHPMCMGKWTCSDENRCGWKCGVLPEPATQCFSSGSCADDEYCTTEDGVCNSAGMLAVCAGTCEKGARQ